MKKKNKKYYTYVYYDPVKNEPFYVGVGTEYRSQYHLKEAKKDNFKDKNRHKIYQIKAILSKGLEPEIRLVFENSKEKCLEEEIRLIKLYGRADLGLGPLTNLTDGGDQGSKGHIWSEELRQWKSEQMSGENNPRFGKPAWNRGLPVGWNRGLTKETDSRVALNGKNVGLALRGRTQSNESNKKRSEKLKGRKSPNTGNKYKLTTEQIQRRQESRRKNAAQRGKRY